MATYRIGIGSFNLKDGAIGIGTESTGLGNLKVEGTIKTTDLDVGVSTFTRYSGFEGEQTNITRDQTLSGEYSTTGDIVVDTGATLTVGLGSTACIGAVECLSIKNHFSVPVGDTAGRNKSSGYAEGTVRYNRDLETMEFYNGNEWRQFTVSGASGRAIFAAGNNSDSPDGTSHIEFVQISSQGDGIEFGNLTRAAFQVGGAGSNIRGVFAGGDPGPSGSDVIDYITLASSGDAIDFGNLSAGGRCAGGASSQTRALFGGVNSTNAIEYVQIQTLGNAVDFGDIANGQSGTKGYLTSSPTRFFYFSGNNDVANIEFGTIASLGNTTTFGDSTSIARRKNFASNTTRAIFAGGYTGSSPTQTTYKAMDFITMASEGNAVVFGDLTVARSRINMTGDERTCLMAGGHTTPQTYTSSIEFVNYSSQGNAQHFGDLSITKSQGAATSDSHGGLGGY